MESVLSILSVFGAFSILGYIISKWANETPPGLLKFDQLSDAVSKNPSWHLPIVVVGVIMSFILNFVTNILLYALYAIMYLLARLVDLLKAIIDIIKWIYANILVYLWELIKKIALLFIDLLVRVIKIGVQLVTYVIEFIIMIVKIAVRYIVTIPIEVILAVINGVSATLKLNFYFRTLRVLVIASFAAGLILFIGNLIEQEEIGKLGAPFVLAIALTYIVGMVVFDNKENGKKAAIFSLSVVGLIAGTLAALYSLNLLDGISSWGAVFAGLWYAPSVLSIALMTILLITVLFSTNVGAIYVNTDGANVSFLEKLKGSICESFNRSYSFILQPIFSVIVGALIVAIPYYLLINSAEVLKDSIVGPIVSSSVDDLAKDLAKNQILAQEVKLTTDTSVTQSDFDSSLVKLGIELELERKVFENKRYNDYISNAIMNGITFGIVPVAENKTIQAEINSSQTTKKDLIKSKAESLEAINDEIKDLEENLDAQNILSNESMVAGDTLLANNYAALANQFDMDINYAKLKLDRKDKFMTAHIDGISAKIDYENGNSLRYNLTYLMFILGSGILSACLITFLANVYASSVKPVYEMWKSNFIVDQVKEARSKDPLQPWVGILIMILLFGGSLFSNANMNLPKSLNFDALVENSSNDEPVAPAEQAEQAEQAEPQAAEPQAAEPAGMQVEEFTCYDGVTIPISSMYDGYCDCNSCEDEQVN